MIDNLFKILVGIGLIIGIFLMYYITYRIAKHYEKKIEEEPDENQGMNLAEGEATPPSPFKDE